MKTEVLRLESLSDDVLLARVEELVKRNRRVETELIWHLAEVDRRRLYLREACPSMHVYATSRLRLSEAEAYLRITVARVSRRFPIVLGMLADGRLHVSAIAKLAPHLSDENCQALLQRAVHRSKREIEALVAKLAPKPDVRSLIRRLPGSQQASEAAELVPGRVGNQGVAGQEKAAGNLAVTAAAALPSALGDSPPVSSDSAPSAPAEQPPAWDAAPSTPADPPPGPSASVPPTAVPSVPAGPRTAARAVMAPLAPARFRVQFTASSELHQKIEQAKALLRHQVPDGDLGIIFDRAMTLLVRELERVRFAATAEPRKVARETDPTPRSRKIPGPIRRAVWSRDGGQCTYRDQKGRRCSGRERLEFHHLVPFARGGDHGESNVVLRCRGHNMYQAEIDFGPIFGPARRHVV